MPNNPVDFKLKTDNVLDFQPTVPNTYIHTDVTPDAIGETETNTIISQISTYRPSYVLNNFNVLLGTIISIKAFLDSNITNVLSDDMLSSFEDFKNTYNSNYIVNNDNSIYGNTLIEAWDIANRLHDEINNLFGVYKNIYYKDSITQEEASSIDEQLINTLSSADDSKINYPVIIMDVQINQILNSYLGVVSSYASGLSQLVFTEPNAVENNNLESLYSNLFISIARQNNNDNIQNKKYIDSKAIESCLINFANQRQDAINTMKISSQINNSSDTIDSYINDYINNVFNSIVDFHKSIMCATIYKNNYINSLFEKDKIRNIYNISFS